ncbi:MAG: hypothetical protein IJG18_07535 [Kiritimatiellae bacterium]|nr:hypothetical protein [Kiritimatiellia bacterium]
MKNEIKTGLIVLGSILIGAVGSWFVFNDAGDAADSSCAVREQRLAKSRRSGNVKKVTEISVNRKGKSVRIVESESPRPNVLEAAEIDDEADLSDIQRSVLEEIQAALDADDLKALRKAISRFTASVGNGGLGGYANVPRAIRSAAVQALGWFGKDSVVDLVDFMVDSDEEISSDAFDKFEFALEDVDLGDRDRADIVKTVAKALTDEDRIDTLLFNLNDMRNSVKVETAVAILTDGTAMAKSVLKDQLGFFFDEGVETIDDIQKWYAENPDDPDDDDFYGGDKE